MNHNTSSKIIDNYRQSFRIKQTPYKNDDFSEITKEFCQKSIYTTNEIRTSKVIILGDVSVGKTCLVNSFCHQTFNSNYKATIGVDFEVEQFFILGVPLHLQIWDTAGQERFKCIAQSYYRFAQVIVVVFDLSKINTLSNCKIWLEEALHTSAKDPFIFLVGTKKDLISSVTYNELETSAIKVADSMKAEFWSVSSKTGENIPEFFFRIAALTFDSIISREHHIRQIPIVQNEIISFKNNKHPSKVNNIKCCTP